MLTFWYFVTLIFFRKISIVQPPLQIFFSNTSDPEFRSGNMCAIFALSDISGRLGFIFPLTLFPPFGRYASISYPLLVFSCLCLVFGVSWIFFPESTIHFLVTFCGIPMILAIDFFVNLDYIIYFIPFYLVFFIWPGNSIAVVIYSATSYLVAPGFLIFIFLPFLCNYFQN